MVKKKKKNEIKVDRGADVHPCSSCPFSLGAVGAVRVKGPCNAPYLYGER